MRQGHEWNVYLFQVIDATRNLLFRPKSKKKRRGFSFGESSYVNYEEVNTKKSSKNVDTKRMDEILDKIKDKGYDSLSKEEKAFLFKISKDDWKRENSYLPGSTVFYSLSQSLVD